MQASAPFFKLFPKGWIPNPFLKTFFLICGSTTHSSYYPPLALPLPTLHSLPQIPPKHLGLAHSWSQFGFPSRSLSAALVANHTLARQWASPTLFALVNPGKKKPNLSSRITNMLPLSADLSEKIRCSDPEPGVHQVSISAVHRMMVICMELYNWVPQCWTLLPTLWWICCLVWSRTHDLDENV